MRNSTRKFYLEAKSCRDLACYSATLGPFCVEHANLRRELQQEAGQKGALNLPVNTKGLDEFSADRLRAIVREAKEAACPHTYMEQVIPLQGPLEEEHGYRGSTARAWSRCSRCHKSLNAILRECEKGGAR